MLHTGMQEKCKFPFCGSQVRGNLWTNAHTGYQHSSLGANIHCVHCARGILTACPAHLHGSPATVGLWHFTDKKAKYQRNQLTEKGIRLFWTGMRRTPKSLFFPLHQKARGPTWMDPMVKYGIAVHHKPHFLSDPDGMFLRDCIQGLELLPAVSWAL